jgi:acyl-CoA thioesterase
MDEFERLEQACNQASRITPKSQHQARNTTKANGKKLFDSDSDGDDHVETMPEEQVEPDHRSNMVKKMFYKEEK